jgi:hypothetical protein
MTPQERANLDTQVGHSGNLPEGLGREVPTNEFDNTSLQEAVDRNLVVVPETAPQAPPVVETTPNIAPNKPSHKGRNAIIGGIATIAVAGGAVAAWAGLTNNATSAPNSGDGTSQGDTNGDTTGGNQVTDGSNLTVEALTLPADKTPEQLGEVVVVESLNKWILAGATEANQSLYFQSGGDPAFTEKLAAQNAEVFGDALLVSGWRQNGALADWVNEQKKINVSALERWFETYNDPEDNNIAYTRSDTVDSSVVSADGSVVVNVTSHSNADKNTVGTKDPGSLTIEGDKFSQTFTFEGNHIASAVSQDIQ